MYSSPLSRAAETGRITWEGILHGDGMEDDSEDDTEERPRHAGGGKEVTPVFKEKLRYVAPPRLFLRITVMTSSSTQRNARSAYLCVPYPLFPHDLR